MIKRLLSILHVLLFVFCTFAQNFDIEYQQLKKTVHENYTSFRDECNQKYADFLRTAWDWYIEKAPLPIPMEKNSIPPLPYEPIHESPIAVEPSPIKTIEPKPQPKPISPIKEKPNPLGVSFPVNFYGITCEIRLPEVAKSILKNTDPNSLADAWEVMCTDDMNNTIRDCLETRIRYKLCDWAYLLFLHDMAKQYCSNANTATLLAAFLYCQSGYKIRLGEDNGKLVMLIASDHYIYERPYYIIDETAFYPIGDTSKQLKICNAYFEGETPLSLYISEQQFLGSDLSEVRSIKSKRFSELEATSKVPVELIKFYNGYPTSVANNNHLTRWAMYANTPLAEKTKELLYPGLKKSIEGVSHIDAANKLLNWVQTGFVYEYDDKVWGHDRAFFAEETLYYPYADCEDRSILFSRLIRDLLDLDVALIYYPGHLATAVKFDTGVQGDAMVINGDRYIVCDPTYIGAPVGAQMPDLEYNKAQAIVLKR